MAGLYVHIPFCFSRCGYCDFFKTTQLEHIEGFVENLKNEMQYRAPGFQYPVNTIYFGGGTPSLLSPVLLGDILNGFRKYFNVTSGCEITLEGNPDDLNPEYLDAIFKEGVNRLSIGIQSFNEADLQRMGRRHNARQSRQVVEDALGAGFENISVDFIYGLPWSSRASFLENLEIYKSLPVQHISAYHLTIEKGTPFFIEKRHGHLTELTEAESYEQYLMVCKAIAESGMIHYEVSNFCRPGYHSQHNSSYWKGIPYLGLGPGSHSNVHDKRFWNKSNLKLYLEGAFDLLYEEETLTKIDRYNELIMLGLRTIWGVDSVVLQGEFPDLSEAFLEKADKWCQTGWLFWEDVFLKCHEENWFQVDAIIEDFMTSNDE